MTGMGRAQGSVQGTPIRFEIKSVNHRFCEINVRLPGRFYIVDSLIRQFIKSKIARGKIDVFAFEEKDSNLNDGELKAYQDYYTYLKNIETTLGLESSITMRDLINGVGSWSQKTAKSEDIWSEIQPVLLNAIQDLDKMRCIEGQNLKKDFESRFENIQNISQKLQSYAESIKSEIEEKLKKRIQEKADDLQDIDTQRLNTEILYYLDRLDVTEELKRIGSHLNQASKFIEAESAIGRKMDFLLQELNREFNTIASKSQNAEVAHLVVDAKTELEKIREQVQNIE